MKGYVVYEQRRYRIISRSRREPYHDMILRLRPFRGPDVMVAENLVTPWKRGTVRHLMGKMPHRDKRPVNIHIDTATEIIRVKLKGKRKGFECTFGGLYDVLARQQAMNDRRDRAFRRRTGRRA